MPSHTIHYIGQRLSFESSLCTVRYVGPVDGTEGLWLGVEWDDPRSGKHSGVHKSTKYFQCRSGSSKAASFVRPRRLAVKSVSFLDAVRNKYVAHDATTDVLIDISGKVVEKVGFEKVENAQAKLEQLRVVLVDGQHIAGIQESAWNAESGLDELKADIQLIGKTCPNIQELNMSRNLLESLLDVAAICKDLHYLQILTLNGNRLHTYHIPSEYRDILAGAFSGVKELQLDGNLLTWAEVAEVVTCFPNLQTLSLAANEISEIPITLTAPGLRSLLLPHNAISSLAALSPLASIPQLQTLSLHDNVITSLESATKFPLLTSLDLSANAIAHTFTLNNISTAFPSLASIRVSGNPFFDALPGDDAFMLSLARIPKVSVFNYSNITSEERENAELFYLSKIVAELGSAPELDEPRILGSHPQWAALCNKYGQPTVKRSTIGGAKPGSLAARLVSLKLHDGKETAGENKEIVVPKTINMYMLKSIVGSLFDILPICFKMVLETGEWDPVSTTRLEKNEDSMFDVDRVLSGKWTLSDAKEFDARLAKDKWIKREVDLKDGNSPLGFWVEGMQASIRIDKQC